MHRDRVGLRSCVWISIIYISRTIRNSPPPLMTILRTWPPSFVSTLTEAWEGFCYVEIIWRRLSLLSILVIASTFH